MKVYLSGTVGKRPDSSILCGSTTHDLLTVTRARGYAAGRYAILVAVIKRTRIMSYRILEVVVATTSTPRIDRDPTA
jgi:hypothetical protein